MLILIDMIKPKSDIRQIIFKQSNLHPANSYNFPTIDTGLKWLNEKSLNETNRD